MGHAVTTVGTAAHATEYKGKLAAACHIVQLGHGHTKHLMIM